MPKATNYNNDGILLRNINLETDINRLLKSIADDYDFTSDDLQGKQRKLPPVDKWNPENCGEIGLEIRKDGSWWHQGGKFTRIKLAQLFATILRCDDDGKTYLVTPYEKVIVHVEDAHFVVIRADKIVENGVQKIVFTTNLGDVFELSSEHKLWVVTNPESDEPRPYVMVRGRLFALINRAVFYELVSWAIDAKDAKGNDILVIESNNETFSLGQI